MFLTFSTYSHNDGPTPGSTSRILIPDFNGTLLDFNRLVSWCILWQLCNNYDVGLRLLSKSGNPVTLGLESVRLSQRTLDPYFLLEEVGGQDVNKEVPLSSSGSRVTTRGDYETSSQGEVLFGCLCRRGRTFKTQEVRRHIGLHLEGIGTDLDRGIRQSTTMNFLRLFVRRKYSSFLCDPSTPLGLLRIILVVPGSGQAKLRTRRWLTLWNPFLTKWRDSEGKEVDILRLLWFIPIPPVLFTYVFSFHTFVVHVNQTFIQLRSELVKHNERFLFFPTILLKYF